MKARIPTSYLKLPQREREAIDNLVLSEINKALDEEEVALFAQYSKMLCIVLHDHFGFGEDRLYRVLGSFKALKRKYRKLKTAQEIRPALEKEMERIFKKSKFPTDFVESLQRDE